MPAENAESAAHCGICSIIEQIKGGTLADFIGELPSSYLVLGDAQFYRGYCVMLAKRHATEIFLMPTEEARALLDDMRLAAEAIASATRPWKMNYECLGNQEAHVHWHLLPRYESDDMRRMPIWVRPDAERKVTLSPEDRAALMSALREHLAARFPDARFPSN